MRRLCIPIAAVLSAILLAACGTNDISVSGDDPTLREGAELFATHCAGCHTLTPAGTQGSGNRALRVQGPNLDQRTETHDEVLFAIHNGGASGAIMPQNIVTGEEADKVAAFVARYAGTEVKDTPRPSAEPDGGGAGDATQGGSAGSGSQSDDG